VLRAADTPPVRAGLRLALLTLGVVCVHLWLVDRHLPSRLGEGAADRAPKRMEVSFVRELAQATPAFAAPAASPKPLRSAPAAWPVAGAASAPESVGEPLGEGAADAAAEAVPPPASVPPPDIAPPPALSAALETAPMLPPLPAASATPAASPAAFEWPPSTRLSYTLSGDFRGPVVGTATVEWLRAGSRYQVRMEVSAGLLFSRRVSSEGEITPEGLQPRRYDEETKVVLRDARRQTIWLDGDRVRLPGGTDAPRPAGVQDSASQFVQMTWLFTTRPALLERGRTVDIPLALPRRVETWVYEVLETETLHTPVGPVQAVHVKPRREGKPNELVAEMWVAPSLQYLPVRLLIRQDAQTYIDLLIERLPQQAEPGR
jgi:hypothetical protein